MHSATIPAIIALGGVTLIGLAHLPISFAPGIRTWGFDYWSELPVAARAVLASLLCLIAIPAVARAANDVMDRIASRRFATGVAVLILLPFVVLFRSRGYAYGDGYSLLSLLQSETFPYLFDQLLRQPLDIIAHWSVERVVVDPLGLPVGMSYALLGAFAGVAALLAIWRIARHLAPDAPGVRLILASALTSGAVVLWFGHLESYTLANSALLWSLSFALEARRRPSTIWWAWAMCLVGIAFHQLVIVMVPVLIWVHWTQNREIGPGRGSGRALLLFASGFLACLVGASVYNAQSDPIFVPLLPSAVSAYTAFSLHHLTDVFNLVLFLAPLVPLALLGLLGRKPARDSPSSDAHTIVAAVAASTFFFAFWVDPFLGAFRDWDLLAAFGIPTCIWTASVLLQRLDLARVRAWLWVPVAGLAIAHSGAFVATVQNETAVALRIDRMVREDIHYSVDFYKGTRLAPWARVLDRALGRHDLERDHLGSWTAIDPGNDGAWANLANAYLKLRMGDSALFCFERAWQLNPANDAYGYNTAVLRLKSGDSLNAVTVLEEVVATSDTSYSARVLLGTVRLKLGMLDRAESVLSDAVRLSPGQPGAYLLLAETRERLGNTAGAIQVIEEAVRNGGDSPELHSYRVKLQSQLKEKSLGSGP